MSATIVTGLHNVAAELEALTAQFEKIDRALAIAEGERTFHLRVAGFGYKGLAEIAVENDVAVRLLDAERAHLRIIELETVASELLEKVRP